MVQPTPGIRDGVESTLRCRTLCELGGWKNARTILKSYQQADHATMRQALAIRQRTVRAKPA